MEQGENRKESKEHDQELVVGTNSRPKLSEGVVGPGDLVEQVGGILSYSFDQLVFERHVLQLLNGALS